MPDILMFQVNITFQLSDIVILCLELWHQVIDLLIACCWIIGVYGALQLFDFCIILLNNSLAILVLLS